MSRAWLWWAVPVLSGAIGLTSGRVLADDGFRVLHTFTGLAGGGSPGPVVGHQGAAGPGSWALFGAANADGAGNGIVFKLTPPVAGSTHWIETRLYVFQDYVDGDYTFGPLAFDAKGAIYGATEHGGSHGGGTVYRLTPPSPAQYFWNRTILHSFGSGADGLFPESGVVLDSAGNVYGTTIDGGSGAGIVYRLSPPASAGGAWSETILHAFNGADGVVPWAGLLLDPAGVLYGATSQGGAGGHGTIFALAPPAAGGTAWTFSTLYAFPSAGFYGPRGTLARVASGALYGTAWYADTFSPTDNPDGAVFELDPPTTGHGAWALTILHRFSGVNEAQPGGVAMLDGSGALYGATAGSTGLNALGLVYKLTPPAAGQTAWTYAVLHTFTPNLNYVSGVPAGTLITDGAGTIYGATLFGGPLDTGTVFKITP